jgi:hypothetical protein
MLGILPDFHSCAKCAEPWHCWLGSNPLRRSREGLEPSLFDGNQGLALRSSDFGHLPRRQDLDITRGFDARQRRVAVAPRRTRITIGIRARTRLRSYGLERAAHPLSWLSLVSDDYGVPI